MQKDKYMWTGKVPIWRGTGHRRGDVMEFTKAEAAPYLDRGAVVPYNVGKRADEIVAETNSRGQLITWESALEKAQEKIAPKKEEVKS